MVTYVFKCWGNKVIDQLKTCKIPIGHVFVSPIQLFSCHHCFPPGQNLRFPVAAMILSPMGRF